MMNKFNNTVSGVKGVINTGTSIIGAGTAGFAVGGAVGAAIGSILGIVNEAINLTTEYNTKRAQIEWDLETERLTGTMAANRLGLASSVRGRVAFNKFKM